VAASIFFIGFVSSLEDGIRTGEHGAAAV